VTVAEEPRREHRLLKLIGHYGYLGLAVLVVTSVADNATAHHIRPLGWAASVSWGLWAAGMMLDARFHRSHLCERCVAETPLDWQRAVDRWDRALWLHHAAGWQVLVLLPLGGTYFWVMFTQRPGPLIYVLGGVLIVVIGIISGVDYKHRRLYPWCPYCHWGDGGDPEPSPEPEPAPAVSR
jgi:hypothetical protein